MEIRAQRAATGAGDRWTIEVDTGGRQSAHTVTVSERVALELGFAPEEVETLLRASFEFLLEREPPDSILSAFALQQIGDYFEDYREVVGRTPG